MKRITAIIFLSVMAFSAFSQSNDRPSKNHWSGFYIAGSLGNFQNNSSVYSDNIYGSYSPNATYASKINKNNLGIQAGYNWNINSYILGLELDVNPSKISKSTCRGSQDPTTSCGDYYYGTLTLVNEISYKGAIKGRVGYEFSDFMIYASGGVAFVKATNTLNVDCPSGCGASDANAITTSSTVSKNSINFTYGFGAEYALDKSWKLGVDYMYFKVPNLNQTLYHSATYGTQTMIANNANSNSIYGLRLIYNF
jgi:opacity protein-like surface antigen